jgi:hypothetical protein
MDPSPFKPRNNFNEMMAVFEPFSDQAQDHRICNAMGYHLA